MSLVRPFRGVRFSQKAGELKDLMAPPYDVIDDDFRQELYGRSDYNIVRISKSAEIAKEAEEEHYTSAAKTWNSWLDDGITLQDEKPSFYFYEQEFDIAGETFKRLGLICAHKLVPFGEGVLPHEKTLSGPKVDRHRLLNQTKTHFGQIFGLYSDDDGAIDKQLRAFHAESEAIFSAKDDDDVTHSLSKISDSAAVEKISSLFSGKDMIIADGHHRYETALKYSKELATEEASYLMMTAVSLANDGLLILPTHRLVKNLENWNLEEFLGSVQQKFAIERLKCTSENKMEVKDQALKKMKEAFSHGQCALTLYSGNDEFVVMIKKADVQPDVEGSEDYKKLDVVALHKLVLEDLLGIDQAKLAAQSNVEYIKDSGDAIDRSIALVDSGSHQAVFLMNETPLDQTQKVAENGEKMPQKSTFFHPKVFTGLVTYMINNAALKENG